MATLQEVYNLTAMYHRQYQIDVSQGAADTGERWCNGLVAYFNGLHDAGAVIDGMDATTVATYAETFLDGPMNASIYFTRFDDLHSNGKFDAWPWLATLP